MTQGRFHEPARLSNPYKPLFSLTPLDTKPPWVNVTLSQPSISVAQEGKKYNTGTQGKERVDRGKISVNTKKLFAI